MKIKNTKNLSTHNEEEKLYSDYPEAKGDAWQRREFFLFEPKTLLVVIVTSVLTLLITFFGDQGVSFLTSVISPAPTHAPFNGTVGPVKEVPNWVKLTEAERKAPFDQISSLKRIPLPTYNASRLALSSQSLQWNNPADDQIRNEKITYSVPYCGSYRLDGVEGSGSHCAVDLKLLIGTPIIAISNGLVTKAEISNGGFGYHIVIKHNDVPSLDNGDIKTTYFSSYSHLSAIQVAVNDVVTKGQQIGLSGMTGTATTPHLHFQIDTDAVAWHPFWPFTSNEMRAAGYSFFEAINNGLNSDKARASTINPMLYVQKYYQGQAVVQAPVISDVPLEVITPVISPLPVPQSEELKTNTSSTSSVARFAVTPEQTVTTPGVPLGIRIEAQDSNGTVITQSVVIENETIVLGTNPSFGSFNTQTLSASQFVNGVAKIYFTSPIPGTTSVVIPYKGEIYGSPIITVSAGADINNNNNNNNTSTIVPIAPPFADVSSDSPYFTALVALKAEGLISGYADGTYHPEKEVTRAEAITFILRVLSEEVRNEIRAIFPDVPEDQWFAKYVTTAFEMGFVKGYPDGTFKPTVTVNLAEFSTMLFVAARADIDPEITITLPNGVATTDWFAPYIQAGIKKGFLTVQNNTIDAAKALTRGEVAEIVHRLRSIVTEIKK